MTDYDNTNRGAIWNNTKKRPDKEINGKMVSDPDYTGEINIEGHLFWVDAWKPGPSDNPKAPVLRFRVKRKDSVAPADYQKPTPAVETLPDDIPVKDDFDPIPF